MDEVVDVENPLFPPNWKVDLLLSPGMSLLSNMPAHHYDTSNINTLLLSPEMIYNKHNAI
jgi:hypothetical protein